MQPQRHSQRLSNSNKNKRHRIIESNLESQPSGSNIQQKRMTKSSSSVLKMKEQTITPINKISPMIDNMAIKGRLTSVWHSHKLNEQHDPYSLDCVFQDEESNRIQIFVKKELMFKFEPLLQEGQCYIISNFGVAENGGRLPLLPNRWKISLYKGSEIKRIEQIDENFIGFVNEPFTRILDPNNQYHEHDSVDVVGTVVAIGNIIPVNGYGCSKIRRTVVIEDAESLRLECTFWDNWALMWNEYSDKLDEVGHLDILLILGKVKYWNNKPAIHNALFGTRIYINKDITPLKSFRKSYEAQNGNNASDFRIEIHNQENHVVTPAEFMQGSVKRMVGMIRNIEPETHCVVYATIHSIQYENGWAYTGCKACNTKVTAIASKGASSSKNQKQLWHCKKHGETYAVVSRFKIIVRIFDETGTAQVVIFDNNVYKMTKLSAWEIMEKQGMDADRYFPDDLNQIIGKQYLFKVKYSEFNHNNNSHVYRAEKVTEDVETINYFKNGFFDDETGDEEYSSESKEVNEDDEDYFSSTSIEENEDEEDDFTITPTQENENTEDDITSCDKPSNDGHADGSDKQTEPIFIDLSDYETEDENEACNTLKKVVTVKLEKDP
ncbi:replication protein A 70 kDa DNA-binding subunit B [Tanacetum coccineum]|uniref:Replication protein A 70 kDa DNA-binding subunit B n=1 Tax=Tanacetum coccineum TaxID=301880 RepID=A0ABQ5DZM2_9ASTR